MPDPKIYLWLREYINLRSMCGSRQDLYDNRLKIINLLNISSLRTVLAQYSGLIAFASKALMLAETGNLSNKEWPRSSCKWMQEIWNLSLHKDLCGWVISDPERKLTRKKTQEKRLLLRLQSYDFTLSQENKCVKMHYPSVFSAHPKHEMGDLGMKHNGREHSTGWIPNYCAEKYLSIILEGKWRHMI